MGWKNWPSWLKGGIIFSILVFIFNERNLLFFAIYFTNVIFFKNVAPYMNLNMINQLISLIIRLFIAFIIGGFFGLIYSKMQEAKKVESVLLNRKKVIISTILGGLIGFFIGVIFIILYGLVCYDNYSRISCNSILKGFIFPFGIIDIELNPILSLLIYIILGLITGFIISKLKSKNQTRNLNQKNNSIKR